MAHVAHAGELVVKAVERDEELRLANDLMAKAHMSNYFRASDWFETCGSGYPGFEREHTRIALWNGELAGALRLSTDTIRLGEARLKMGGLGWVTTAPRHRHKGVCTALMADALQYMRGHRYHVSMLFGIPNFYHRFGYATTLADYTVVMDVREASRCAPEPFYRMREAKPGDIPAIQKIHNANDTDVPCSLVRTAAHLTNRWEAFRDVSVVTNAAGKVLGYARTRSGDREFTVHEAGSGSMAVYSDILYHCAAQAQEACAGQLRFLTPPGHPFSQYLLRFASVHETRVVREAGGMMAFVDFGETLENLIPEWEHRLGRSVLRDERVEVTLVVDRLMYRVRANRGAIDVAQCHGSNKFSVTNGELMQLVTGYRHLGDVLPLQRRLLTDAGHELLSVLFPKRDPYVWTFDRF